MSKLTDLSERNIRRAFDIIKQTDIVKIWESFGARVNLVGSLKMGLLLKHLDIDLHVYTPRLDASDSFAAMAELSKNPNIKRIEVCNLQNTDQSCIEWHAWYKDVVDDIWQIDIIHIEEGSRFDGYFENVAKRITEVMTDTTREIILQLKNSTPETKKVAGIMYYQAVIRDGVSTYKDFEKWLRNNSNNSIVDWMP